MLTGKNVCQPREGLANICSTVVSLLQLDTVVVHEDRWSTVRMMCICIEISLMKISKKMQFAHT